MRAIVAPCYAAGGRPSIDPVVEERIPHTGRSGASVHGAQSQECRLLRLRHAGQAGDIQPLVAAVDPRSAPRPRSRPCALAAWLAATRSPPPTTVEGAGPLQEPQHVACGHAAARVSSFGPGALHKRASCCPADKRIVSLCASEFTPVMPRQCRAPRRGVRATYHLQRRVALTVSTSVSCLQRESFSGF